MERKKRDSAKIKSAFGELLKTYKLESRFHAARLKTDWERLLGKPIASRTARITVSNGKVTVYLKSAPLKSELNMSKSKILEILRNEYPEAHIQDIIFL